MATKKVKIKVGVFLLVCFSIILAAVTYISGLYKGQGEHYWMEFDESVLGVYEGGIVEYLGLPVGKVSHMSVTPNNRAHIEITLDPKKIELKQGVEGQLVLYSLAAGTMAVELSGGDPEGGPLPPDSQIPTRPSAFTAISTKVEKLMSDVSSIVAKVENGLSGMEEGDLNNMLDTAKKILDDFQSLTVEARLTLQSGQETIAKVNVQIDPLSDEVKALSQNIRKTSEDAGAFLKVATEKTSQLDVAGLGDKVDEVLQEITELTMKLNASVANLDESSATMLHEADNLEYTFRATLSSTSDTLLALETLLNQLKDDPSSLVRGKGKIKE